MIIRKPNLDILETPDDKLQSNEERWQKSFIEGELCQNEPIPVDENEIAYTMIQHGCYDDEQKLIEKLVANWDSLSQSEKEVAHYVNGTFFLQIILVVSGVYFG
jgi:phenylalanyl-tRNA synthetase alpha subunit